MKIPDYARYNYCIKRSCEFLEEHKISQFPLNPLKIIELNKWGIITYSELAQRQNCTIKDTIIALKSKDAFTIYDNYNYTIAYNDTKNEKRILFTLLHEIGHIYLKHLIDFENTTLFTDALTKSEQKLLENEANAFARNSLAPALFIKKLKKKSMKVVSSEFGISSLAAKTRLDILETDFQIIKSIGYQDRFNRLYINFYYRHGCLDCGATLFTINARYCSICGSEKIEKRKGIMYYKEYEVHKETNKLKTCLVCGNENTNIEGEYCQICGKILVNKCDNRYQGNGYDNPCGKSVPSNARYCPYCSNPTTFFNAEVLKEWEEEATEADETAEIEAMIPNDYPTYDMLDMDIEEELPFI